MTVKLETPALGKAFFLEYDNEDKNYPVVGITRNPNEGRGMTPPALGDACPDSRYSATHILTGYRVSHPDQRVIEVYQKLPGPEHYEKKVDPEMDVTITTVQQEVAKGSFSPSATIVGSSLVVVDEKEVNEAKSIKITTTIPQPAAQSSATAVLGQTWLSEAFPARLIPDHEDLTGQAVIVHQPRAELVPATTRKWWVISDTIPSIGVDEINLGYTYRIYGYWDGLVYITKGKYFNNVLHGSDSYGNLPSTPSDLEYITSWIGQEKVRKATVQATKYQKLWEVETISVVMR